jgi:murein DD-endopeptidase MepM/ murein hydrolase activator NlpD
MENNKSSKTIVIVIGCAALVVFMMISGTMFKGERADPLFNDNYLEASKQLGCKISYSQVEKARIYDMFYLDNTPGSLDDVNSIRERFEKIYVRVLKMSTGPPVCVFNSRTSILAKSLYPNLSEDDKAFLKFLLEASTMMYGTVLPIEKGKFSISAPYGMYYEEDGWHWGVDFAASYMTPVMAFADGTVVNVIDGHSNSSSSPSYGNIVSIKHRIIEVNGKEITLYSHYFHLTPGSIKVKIGDKVSAGQVIAGVGQSGKATGYHLHFVTSKYARTYSGWSATYDPNNWIYIR